MLTKNYSKTSLTTHSKLFNLLCQKQQSDLKELKWQHHQSVLESKSLKTFKSADSVLWKAFITRPRYIKICCVHGGWFGSSCSIKQWTARPKLVPATHNVSLLKLPKVTYKPEETLFRIFCFFWGGYWRSLSSPHPRFNHHTTWGKKCNLCQCWQLWPDTLELIMGKMPKCAAVFCFLLQSSQLRGWRRQPHR